jgi:hypothetical protein
MTDLVRKLFRDESHTLNTIIIASIVISLFAGIAALVGAWNIFLSGHGSGENLGLRRPSLPM